jgi:hypothetical protein
MSRSRNITIAAILQVALGLFYVVVAVRILAGGSAGGPELPGTPEGSGPPFWAGIMFLSVAMISLFSAYGLWIGQKWGKILAIVTCVIGVVFGLGDLVGMVAMGLYGLAAISASQIGTSLATILLVLRRQPRAVLA